MSAVAEQVSPVSIGKDIATVEMAAEAVARAAAAYRIYPNYPECQDMKASYWREYQRCCAHLMEVMTNA